jgi:hypothetical protein
MLDLGTTASEVRASVPDTTRVALAVLAEAQALMRAHGPPRIAGCALSPTRSSANRSRQQGAVPRLA